MRTHLSSYIAKEYKRWRHGRGFGVHSPFAYNFITGTLRERLPYYAYERIEATCSTLSDITLSVKRLKLIFRIIVRFNPKYVMVCGDRNSIAERLAIKSVSRSIAMVSDPVKADVTIINDDTRLTPKKKHVYIFPDTLAGGAEGCEALWAQVSHGLRFDNARGMTIIVTSEAFPRQRFEAKF